MLALHSSLLPNNIPSLVTPLVHSQIDGHLVFLPGGRVTRAAITPEIPSRSSVVHEETDSGEDEEWTDAWEAGSPCS